MRTLTLGIALSALVGSLAFAQTGTTNNGTGNTKSNGNNVNGSSNGSGNTKSVNTNPTTTGETTMPNGTNTTSNVAKSTGRTIAQTVAANDDFDTLESLLTQAGLNGTFAGTGTFTVFAPTDSAFALLGEESLTSLTQPENKAKLTSILTYHVVPGVMSSSQLAKTANANTVNGQRIGFNSNNGNVTVEQVKITQTDIQCSNGVIHVIDAVLVPSESNLAEVANAKGNYSTFLKACKAAGIDATLVKSGNYTVFAPTDEAFAKLPAGMLEMLMQPENRMQLREILSFHVVPGNRWYSTDLGSRSELPTVSGETLSVQNDGGTVTLANGMVVKSDMQATNGVFHGVDTVLLPGVSSTSATVKGKGKPVNGTTATGKEKESN